MEGINENFKQQEKDDEGQQQQPNLIKRTTIIKNSKAIMTPNLPPISHHHTTTTSNSNESNTDTDNNDTPTAVYHKNEFFVIADIVPIETNTSPSVEQKQQTSPTNSSNSNNRTNVPINRNNNNNNNNKNNNNNSPGQLIEIPLSPFNAKKEESGVEEEGEEEIKRKHNNKMRGSITINHIDQLPGGLELREHTVITKTGILEYNDPPCSSSSSLSESKPYIPPPTTQLFPKVEITKKELKKERKIEKHIIEAMLDITGNNEIAGELVTTTNTALPISETESSLNNSSGNEEQQIGNASPKVGKSIKQPYNNKIGSNSIGKHRLKKKKRKSKKKKHLEHKKNSLGETIYKGQQSWLLMRTIQTGILNCISKTSHRNIKEDSDEFFQSLNHTLPIIEEHPNMTFAFKDYCPHAFSRLRDLFNIDSISYVHSICKPWNEVVTPGKSGSIFFFTHDNQYVLKTIPKREAKLLRSLLPEYYEHMKRNPNSLLTKFFGLHRVKPQNGRQVRFLVMKNLFCTPKEITQRFDLKGSTVGRELSAEELKKTCPTLKDLDFRRLGKKIHLGPDRKKLFMHQLSEDCKFLVKLNIMDYSLLIGLHNKEDLVKQQQLLKQQQHSSALLPQSIIEESGGENYSTEESETDIDETSDEDRNNSKDDLRISKKISSIKETKNYLNHFGTSTIETTTTTTTTTFDKPTVINNGSHHHHHHHHSNDDNNINNQTSQYMKPVDNPVLPPVIPNQPSPHPYIKPKISIFEHDKGGMQGIDERSDPMGEYYFMGIIDILMLYSFRKQIEHTYKSIFSKGEVSSVDPVEYAARFINFIADIIV